MTIFKKRDLAQTSDDYYNAYKEDLGKKEEKQTVDSLNTIIKFEFFTLVAGLVFMSYNNFFNHFSIELQENFLTSNLMSFQNTISNNSDSLLGEQPKLAEVDVVMPVKIQEEKIIETEVAILSEKLNINPTDMTLLVEIIKSQLIKSSKPIKEDKIIIGQI